MGSSSLVAACKVQHRKGKAVPMGAATKRLKAEPLSFTTELPSLLASTRDPSADCAEGVTACILVKHGSTLSGGYCCNVAAESCYEGQHSCAKAYADASLLSRAWGDMQAVSNTLPACNMLFNGCVCISFFLQ